MPLQPVDDQWERAVAVVAHPDDLEYGAASAVAHFTEQGKEVAYVLVTSGEAGIAGMRPEEAGPLRQAEQRASAAVVGVSHVEFLDHADGAVEYGLALRRDIAGALRRLRPDVVFGMTFDLTWGDTGPVNHADHRAVGVATLDACRDAANEWLFPEAGPAWRGITRVYLAGAAHSTHFVDVTGTLDRGVASLLEHRAYLDGLGEGAPEPREFLEQMAGYGGMAAGCEYGVLFQAFDVG